MANNLYYGDNLAVLRESIADESVDLIYLDPPFNSQANYNVLFRSPTGEQSQAQIEAFEDTWHWNDAAEFAFDDVMRGSNARAAEILRSMRSALGENDMMAYLAMMAVRLIELHRVLKPTGSIYLHCDPTASHYLKIIMDAIFGPKNFRSEVIWKRTFAHGGASRWGNVHDTILFYTRGPKPTWNKVLQDHDEAYVSSKYRDKDRRGRYRWVVLTGAGTTEGDSGKPWKGYDPTASGRHWTVPMQSMAILADEGEKIPDKMHGRLDLMYEKGFIRIPSRKGTKGAPEYKYYLKSGQPIQDVITDIPPLNSQAQERLGYPTQKPVALLERIISASSNPGDVVLDPFCGCGTAIHAAEKLERRWVGIDITHLAITLIEKRLKDAFPDIHYEVHGTPKDLGGAHALATADKYQFQWWAVSLVNAVPWGGKKKGADSGIDGVVYFKPDGRNTEKAVVSVKGGAHVNVAMIRDLAHVVDRENAKLGIFITLADPTGPMQTEAIKEGLYETPYGRFPKLQILTIEELLNGKRPQLPWLDRGAFKQAPREEVNKQQRFAFG